MLRTFYTLLLLLSLSACSVNPYGAAQKKPDNSYSSGYLDEEVSPGVYVVEVQGSTPSFLINKRQNLEQMQSHWKQRAKELCPHGYQGKAEVIVAEQARLTQLHCDTSRCKSRPLVSGIIWCHQRFSL